MEKATHHLAGERSARFCSASLFMAEMKGATVAIERRHSGRPGAR